MLSRRCDDDGNDVTEHDWTDEWAGDDDVRIDVRHVQPYQAEKTYRCPGCDHEIRPGEGHEVVIPLDAPQDRRHWHTGCWAGEQRRQERARVRLKRRR
jgi:hypothetical protein